jgi:nucleotide-binding universal stress UspA family protein
MAENEASTPQVEREQRLASFMEAAARASGARAGQVLVALSTPQTVEGLIALAAGLCRPGDVIVALKVVPVAPSASLADARRQVKLARRFRDLLHRAVQGGEKAGVAVETVLRVAYDVASGIVAWVNEQSEARLLLLEWSDATGQGYPGADACKTVMRDARCDVLVFQDKGLGDVQRVLVPVGGGPHARLGLCLAADLIKDKTAELVALRVVREQVMDTTFERALVKRLIRDEMGRRQGDLTVLPRVVQSASVVEGILEQVRPGCDLLVVGASEEGLLRHWLFGSIPAAVADGTSCSMLLVRQYAPAPLSWVQRALRYLLGSRPRIRRGGALHLLLVQRT